MLRRVLWSAFRWSWRLGPHLAALDRFAALSPEQARRETSRLLLEQIRYFGRREDALPEWREAARIEDPEELWRVWPSLPCVTKHDLQTRFEPRAMQKRLGGEGVVSSTGGSTGDTNWYYLVRAFNSAGESADSPRRTGRFGSAPGLRSPQAAISVNL